MSTLYKVENLPTNPADRFRRTAKILLRRRMAARTVAISHLQRERYRRFSGTDRGLVIVPNGIADPGLLSADERAAVRRGRGVADDGILAVSRRARCAAARARTCCSTPWPRCRRVSR